MRELTEEERDNISNVTLAFKQPWSCDYCFKNWHEPMIGNPNAEPLRILRLKNGCGICEECVEKAVALWEDTLEPHSPLQPILTDPRNQS